MTVSPKTLQTPASKPADRNPWAWVPSLYLAEGLPNVIAVTVAVILYKQLGISNSAIALYTSWLYLPWVIKPLWSPIVDLLRTRRWWIWMMQLLIGGALAGVAFTIPLPNFFPYTLAFFWLVAFGSATHDIAADGFYMIALEERQQSFFVGIRNTFYRIALICGQGLLVIEAGSLQRWIGNTPLSWSLAFSSVAALLVLLGIYHGTILPRPPGDQPGVLESWPKFLAEFFSTFRDFFAKPGIARFLAFLLLYRFAEAQLVKMVAPFLLDPRETGGLGLTVESVGVVYGTVGVIALMIGGITGGLLVARYGLRAWLWSMVIVMHLPDLAFVYLAYAQPNSLGVISGCVALEQFGYGFGFTAYMLYMIYIARGQHQTAHYAICTGFMALGLMLPGMFSGWLQELLGYRHFFVWVLLATIPGFVVTALIPLDPEFGRRKSS